tara:strand:+ start:181 stop:750 length:570 start_codon:yes stop_codon:yes gene_type:complete
MNETNNNIRNKQILKSVITIIVIILITTSFWFVVKVYFKTDNPIYVVTSGSMSPNINVNDLIIIKGDKDFDSLEVGQVIIYFKPNTPHECISEIRNCIVHRINKVMINDGEKELITKGDNNKLIDNWIITESDYIGYVILVIPKIGIITRILTPLSIPPVNYIIIGIVLFLIFVIEVKKSWSLKRKNTT